MCIRLIYIYINIQHPNKKGYKYFYIGKQVSEIRKGSDKFQWLHGFYSRKAHVSACLDWN